MAGERSLLSIVVPVYNVEKYIDECVDSFYNYCDVNKIQVILIDDGSTDESGKICDRLAKRKSIEVWHKKNGGLASARNYGLDKANGQYVSFVDPDDKIDSASFGKVLETLEKGTADVYFMNITKFYPDGRTEDMSEDVEESFLVQDDKNEAMKYLATRKKFPASACGKIYKLKFLRQNGLKFPDDNRISEDLGFAFDAISLASSYGKIELPYYLYRQGRPGSITSTVSSRSFDGVAMFVSEYAQGKNKLLLSFVAYEYVILLWLYAFVDTDKRSSAKKILKKYQFVLDYGNTKRLRMIRIAVKIFGIGITSKMLYFLRGNKK